MFSTALCRFDSSTLAAWNFTCFPSSPTSSPSHFPCKSQTSNLVILLSSHDASRFFRCTIIVYLQSAFRSPPSLIISTFSMLSTFPHALDLSLKPQTPTHPLIIIIQALIILFRPHTVSSPAFRFLRLGPGSAIQYTKPLVLYACMHVAYMRLSSSGTRHHNKS